MHKEFQNHAEFLTVYVKEAHPIDDDWKAPLNEKENICYPQPKTIAQRIAIANDFVHRFQYDVPLLVDPMENPATVAFAAMPERIYIIDQKGKIVYKGGPGPSEYRPGEVAEWLAKQFPMTASDQHAK